LLGSEVGTPSCGTLLSASRASRRRSPAERGGILPKQGERGGILAPAALAISAMSSQLGRNGQ
jgi:hypothetical protein